MFYRSSGRRSKRFRFKRAFQVTLFLVLCIWLLYQIMHSNDKTKDYGRTLKDELNKKFETVVGRKGNAGSSSGVDIDSDGGNPIEEGDKKENGGDGDDELDRNAEEKVEGSFHNGHDNSQENVSKHGEEDGEKDPETQEKEPQSNEEDNTDTQVRDGDEAMGSDKDEKDSEGSQEENVTNHEEKENEKNPETQQKESPSDEKDNIDTQIRDGDEAVGSDEDERDSKGSAEQTTLSSSEMGSPVNEFDDENGVPETEEFSNSSHDQNEMPTDDKALDRDGKTDASADGETSSEFRDSFDKSSVNGTPETIQEFSKSSQPNDQNDREMRSDEKALDKEEM